MALPFSSMNALYPVTLSELLYFFMYINPLIDINHFQARDEAAREAKVESERQMKMEAKTMAQMEAIRKFMELKETRQKKVKKTRRNRGGESNGGQGGGSSAMNEYDEDHHHHHHHVGENGVASKKLTRSRSATNATTVAGMTHPFDVSAPSQHTLLTYLELFYTTFSAYLLNTQYILFHAPY